MGSIEELNEVGNSHKKFIPRAQNYLLNLSTCFDEEILAQVEFLANDLHRAWSKKSNVFICGNGGSAANAVHMANDFLYGVGACGVGPKIPGMRVEALPANTGILTCLANDTGYENIFSNQLEVKANREDILIVLSGSGNSKNVLEALNKGKQLGMHTYAIVAYSGGKCKELAEHCIHFKIDDMQIAEDTQLIIGHMCMQWLNTHKHINTKNG